MPFFKKLASGLLFGGLLIALALLPGVIFGKNGFSPQELEVFHDRLMPLFVIPGLVYTDVLEESGRLEVGVTNRGLFQAVTRELDGLMVPAGIVDLAVTKPVMPMATLRENVRPLEGGLQVAFLQFLCTLGFNGVRSGSEGFVINSHCTEKQGSVDGVQHYQPVVADGNLIGEETADPNFFRGGSCPKGKKCRYSDSAYDKRTAGVVANLGMIARPVSVNTGSLEIAGSFRVVEEATTNATVDETVNKVGRTTGWSQGKVNKKCVHTAVAGSNIVQLCQDWVKAKVGAGDSGSPVFKITDSPELNDIKLYGILWGGTSDGTIFVYSPMPNIERVDELGPLTTCAAGFSC